MWNTCNPTSILSRSRQAAQYCVPALVMHWSGIALRLDSKCGGGKRQAYYPNHVSEANYKLLEDRGFMQVQRFRGWVDWNNGDVLVYRR